MSYPHVSYLLTISIDVTLSHGGDTHAETTSVNRRWKNDTESWKQTGRGAEDIRKGNERRACESKPDGETTFWASKHLHTTLEHKTVPFFPRLLRATHLNKIYLPARQMRDCMMTRRCSLAINWHDDYFSGRQCTFFWRKKLGDTSYERQEKKKNVVVNKVVVSYMHVKIRGIIRSN